MSKKESYYPYTSALALTLTEMQCYLPILERAEADPTTWNRLTEGTGIATVNGYRNAIEKAKGNLSNPFIAEREMREKQADEYLRKYRPDLYNIANEPEHE